MNGRPSRAVVCYEIIDDKDPKLAKEISKAIRQADKYARDNDCCYSVGVCLAVTTVYFPNDGTLPRRKT